MKKAYETPKAVKYVFNYQENVVASLNGKDGRDPSHPSYNACFIQNTADVSSGCSAGNNKQKKKC